LAPLLDPAKGSLNQPEPRMNPETVKRIEAYLKRTLNPGISLVARPRVTDSVEVQIAGEHVGLVYLIEDEGETSYQLEMTILQEDLE
jgi:hypothetical protein